MAQVIKPKRKFTTGAPTTSDLAEGEIAINTFDKILYIRDNANNIIEVAGGGSGGGGSTTEVTQSSHGLAVKDCIRHNGSAWVKAQANSAATLALGVVTAVDGNTFTVAQSGRFELSSHGLATGQWHYLDAATPGALTTTEPAFSQPIVYTEDADNIFVFPYRPSNVMISGGTPLGIFVDELVGNGSSVDFTMAGDPLDEKNTQVYLNGVYQEKSTYSISGTTLTFSTAPANLTSIEVIRYAATAFVIGVPEDNTISTVKIQDDAVTTAKIDDDAVTTDKLANAINTSIADNTAKVTNATHTGDVTGATALTIADDAVTLAKMDGDGSFDGKIITYDASGDPVHVGPGTDGQVLTSTGAGSPPAFEDAGSGAYSDWTILTTTPTTLEAKGQYLCNDSTARIHTLPAGSARDTIVIANAGSATVTLARTSSQKINSADEDGSLPQGNSVQLVYVDGTIGWFEV